MDDLISVDLSLNIPLLYYICFAFGLSIAVRIVCSILQATDVIKDFSTFGSRFLVAFKGWSADPKKGDKWRPFIIGLLEFLMYPFMMKSGLWIGVGFWISLKTVAHWKVWQDDRSVFNKFLIGNALVIILSFSLLKDHVKVEVNEIGKSIKENKHANQ